MRKAALRFATILSILLLMTFQNCGGFSPNSLNNSSPSNQFSNPVANGSVALNGVCGSSNGSPVPSAPTANLCSTGTASSISGGMGPFAWTCTGTNGGATANCSASSSLIANRVCTAPDAPSYLICITAVQTNYADSIVIKGMITCSGTNACSGNLSGINRTISISGADSQSGFTRGDNYNYSVLQITNSSNVNLSSLIFNDVTSQEYVDNSTSLPSTLSINNVPTVNIDGVTVEHSSAETSLSINTVSNLNFVNSTVTDGGAMGLWLNNITALEINNCTFAQNRSNGVFIQSQGQSNSRIENSQFQHNHRMAVYHSCNGPCGGGQLDIVTEWNLTISNNHIWDGYVEDGSGVEVGGIELNNPTHMTIEQNDIESNTGSAIYSNTGTPDETNILNNTFNGNNAALYNLSGANISGNGPQE